MNVLSEIVAKKRLEIETAKTARPLESFREEALSIPRLSHRPFRTLFDRKEAGVLIAEIKPKSPSAGQLIAESPLDDVRGGPLAVADLYAKSEADIISVLTDEPYFGGTLQLLKDVRERVSQAIFRKDFIIDEYQIYETAACGADAFLLIANILTAKEIAAFTRLGATLGLGTLVEVHDEEELAKALEAKAEIIGINNRNLGTLDVDLATTERLAMLVPAGIPIVSESGISTAEDVKRVRACGVRGILVGTSILQSSDPLAKIAELKHALSI